MELDQFVSTRPFAFHTTSVQNLARVAITRTLASANELAGPVLLGRRPRPTHLTINVGDTRVHIRDQAPIIEANITFSGGWTLATLVERLNSLAFFWPGTERGPRDHGRRHFERYADASEDLVVLRVPTADLVRANPQPLFCAYNSGSPRMSNGRGSPRGPDTFVDAARFPRRPFEVVELVFENRAVLPPSTESATTPEGPWTPLRAA